MYIITDKEKVFQLLIELKESQKNVKAIYKGYDNGLEYYFLTGKELTKTASYELEKELNNLDIKIAQETSVLCGLSTLPITARQTRAKKYDYLKERIDNKKFQKLSKTSFSKK